MKASKQIRDIPFKISIVGYTKEAPPSRFLQKEGEKNVTMYIISVTTPIHNWKVKHRYNDFYNLHELLSLHYTNLPKLPSKTLLSVTSSSKIERRRKDLEQYLVALTAVYNILSDVYLSQFLNISQFFPDYLCRSPAVLCKYEASKCLIFTDINYLEGRDLNYVLCSKGIKKPSKHPSKFKEEEDLQVNHGTEGLVHKSILNGFKFDPREPINIFQDKKVVKTFDLKAHCLQYFPEAAIIAAGFSNGIIAVYKEEKKPKIEEEFTLTNITKFKAFNDRVTKIIINSAKGEMYAVGRSNKIKVIDMAFWTLRDSYKLGSSTILAIHIDENYNLGLSTNSEGELLISDFSTEKPIVKKKLKLAQEPVALMDCDIDSGTIVVATSQTGLIMLVDIEFPFTSVGFI